MVVILHWIWNSRTAKAADVVALGFIVPWTVCLGLNLDLLHTLAPLAAMGSRMPQVVWAAFGGVGSVLEISGLVRRHRGLSHRGYRIYAMIFMGLFFSWIAGELGAKDLGIPGVYYFAWLAAMCLMGIGRLLHLERIEEELSGF